MSNNKPRMGKRQEKTKTSSIAVDVASLDSLDGLHGRMDFFGMDSKKLCNHLHQKLKVVQTWVFIQAILIVLLIAYTALLGVWLAPFFPMNYSDTTSEGRIITLSGLHSDVAKIEKSIHLSNDSVDYLHVWQKGHEDTHMSLNQAVEDITKQLEHESKIAEQVLDLTKQNDEQKKEISSLQLRIDELHQLIRDLRIESVREIEQHNVRIRKLECVKDNISSTLNQLVNSTKDQFCDVVKNLGSTIGRVDVIERRLGNEIEPDVGALQQDVDHLKVSMSNVTKDLNKTMSRQKLNEKRTRDKFIEQDDLRGTALEKQRIMVYAKVGKIQCKLDDLEHSLNDRIGDVLTNSTMIMSLTDRMDVQFAHVCNMVEDVKANATQMIKSVEWEAFQNKKHVNDLIEDVDILEKAEAANSENVASLNKTQHTQHLEFVQFQQEMIHTGDDIKNRMCRVERDLVRLNTTSRDLSTRLGVAEAAMQDIPIDLRGAISTNSAKTIENMALLKADQDQMRTQLQHTSDQLATFAKDLGLGTLNGVQEALQSTSSSSVSVAASTAAVKRDAVVPLRDDSYGEPVPPPIDELPPSEYSPDDAYIYIEKP